MSEQPDWARQLEAAFTRTGHLFTAQAAIAWVAQGEFDKAREQIASLPPEQVDILGMAARALTVLADEEAAKRT